MRSLKYFLKNEDGATIMEYSLITCLITLAAISATVALGVQMFGLFNT